MNYKVMWPWFELEVNQDTEYVDGGMVPYKGWRYLDAAGHGHFYADEDDHYPTLEWIPLPCSMGHGDDCTSEGYYVCRQCRSKVSPLKKPVGQVPIQGLMTYRLTTSRNGERVRYDFGPPQWETLQEVVHQAITQALDGFETEREFSR